MEQGLARLPQAGGRVFPALVHDNQGRHKEACEARLALLPQDPALVRAPWLSTQRIRAGTGEYARNDKAAHDERPV
ncbi:hypothetical protein [Aeromonas bivalvium]|uniref:hypothetical protein n=1 Tax=Aeromonas bivalvium TaxID=440079 RepID=UPI0038D1F76E